MSKCLRAIPEDAKIRKKRTTLVHARVWLAFVAKVQKRAVDNKDWIEAIDSESEVEARKLSARAVKQKAARAAGSNSVQ